MSFFARRIYRLIIEQISHNGRMAWGNQVFFLCNMFLLLHSPFCSILKNSL
jgi:hypothetical protein